MLEPVHDVVYFSPEPLAAARELGLRGFWMAYFAYRAAPLGVPGPHPVAAVCHGFHPDRVRRALPDAWDCADPAAVLEARGRSCADALRRTWAAAPDVADDRVAQAADLAWEAAQAADVPGRALAAANRALERPTDPVQALWQAATTLREHRGDGHVAVLVSRGIPPLHAHILKVAAGESAAEMLRESRGFSEAEWGVAVEELRATGLVDRAGALTAAGTEQREALEAATDRLATRPWAALGEGPTTRLQDLLAPLAEAVRDSGDLPPLNPVGLGDR